MKIEDIKKGDILTSDTLSIKIAAILDEIIFYYSDIYPCVKVKEYDELEIKLMTFKRLKIRGFRLGENK